MFTSSVKANALTSVEIENLKKDKIDAYFYSCKSNPLIGGETVTFYKKTKNKFKCNDPSKTTNIKFLTKSYCSSKKSYGAKKCPLFKVDGKLFFKPLNSYDLVQKLNAMIEDDFQFQTDQNKIQIQKLQASFVKIFMISIILKKTRFFKF